MASHLHTPPKNCTTENVIILLNAGADVNPRGESDLTPLGYAKGFREGPASTAIPTALTAPRPSSKVAPVKAPITTPTLPKTAAQKRPVHRQEASSQPVITPDDCVLDDPDEDMSFFTDPFCEDDADVPSASTLPKVPPQVMKSGSSTAYDKDGLWEALQAST